VAAELFEIGFMMAVLATAAAVATAIRQSVVPFYIIAGMASSGFVAGRLSERYLGQELAVGCSEGATEFITIGAELGIVFLLFFLGLEFNLERLLDSRELIAKAGTIDLVINFGAGLVLGFALFNDPPAALVVAGMVYISSSAIITNSLIDPGWIANDESAPLLGTLVYEDLLIAVYLAILATLLGSSGDIAAAALSVGIAIGFILLLLAVVSFGTPLFARLLETNTHEFVVLRVTGVTVLIAGLALAIGVSEAVAAFFVGIGSVRPAKLTG
jgi:CPA2 family monovalent cation:H+ antiporter-2